MRSTRIVLLLAIVLGLLIPTALFAQSGPDTFKAKCAMCHGPDGKKEMPAMGVKPLTSPEIQKLSEAEVVTVITNGKGKMPAFKGKLSEEQIKAVGAYVKTLK